MLPNRFNTLSLLHIESQQTKYYIDIDNNEIIE